MSRSNMNSVDPLSYFKGGSDLDYVKVEWEGGARVERVYNETTFMHMGRQYEIVEADGSDDDDNRSGGIKVKECWSDLDLDDLSYWSAVVSNLRSSSSSTHPPHPSHKKPKL